MTGLLEAVVPSVGVGLIFWFAMRAIVRADRNERNAVAALEAKDLAAEDAERAAHFGGAAHGNSPGPDGAENSADADAAGRDTHNS